MSQIRNIAISIIALIILYFIVQQAMEIGAPNVFLLFVAFMVVLIIWNVARRLLAGY
jgi:hypothetical protein